MRLGSGRLWPIDHFGTEHFGKSPDPFNGQTVNLILKPPKVIELRTYVKKANLKHY